MAIRYKAKVVRVFDGDTIEVEIKKNSKKTIRFFGVDCPEKNQDFGKIAGDKIRELLKGKEVDIFPIELGKYGREVGIVYINGYSVSEILLKEGLAFASGKNHKLASVYYQLQEKARLNKTGMWKLGAVENPAIFRNRKKSLSFNLNAKLKKLHENNIKNEVNQDITKESVKDKSGLLQQLRNFIGDKIKEYSDQEDKYISSEELLKKMKINKNKPKV